VAVTGITDDKATLIVAVTVATLNVVNSAGGADTVRLKVFELVWPILSVTVTVNAVCARVTEAVPEIRPVPVFIVSPVGRLGLIEYVSVPYPPLPVTGVNPDSATNWVRILDATACTVITGPALTVNANVLELVWPAPSVTVTVYVVVPLRAVGVPVICPVVVLKLRPAGKAGDTANVFVPKPPEAVTGVNGVAAVFCVSVVDATACVVVSAGSASTVRLNVLALVCAGVL
jgi:hypothetical protein